ncbi:MAG: helix-turn-helix transcriptional regulator [Balneolaceae bacterium]|nr:helix-turn-helix transcriptional regulator [Balneolaceae bacterium]MBO6545149.1 helix-turn-helix transcriptional regulator [Balneolaceae bacterium]MBO6646545.1 helix-turn-helix transcriptional regulator [Balneolaceae bacterium]
MNRIDLIIIIGLMSLGLGVFFSAFLLLRKGIKNWSDYLIPLVVLLVSIELFYAISFYSELILKLPEMFGFGRVFQLLVYPLLLIQVIYLRYKTLKWWYILIILPVLADSLFSLYSITNIPVEIKIDWLRNIFQNEYTPPINQWNHWHILVRQIAVPILFLIPINYFSVQQLRASGKKEKEMFLILVVVSLLYFLFRLANNTISIYLYKVIEVPLIDWALIIVFDSVVLILLCYMIVKSVELNRVGFIKNKGSKNTGSIIGEEKMESFYHLAKNTIEQKKLYQKKGFSLNDLSEETNINTTYLSQSINTIEQQSFSEFINSYRISKAKEYLKDREYDYLTVEAISEEVGFKSKSAFYRAFKKEVKCLPKEYKERFLKK